MQTGLPDELRAVLVALIPHTHNLEHSLYICTVFMFDLVIQEICCFFSRATCAQRTFTFGFSPSLAHSSFYCTYKLLRYAV
jgi:hypothetical protein